MIISMIGRPLMLVSRESLINDCYAELIRSQ